MNVLVVSSQPSFLEEGLKALTEKGIVPQVQRTVEEAIAAFQTLSPSLVILDAESASGDLAGTCQALHDISRAPVILVTVEELSGIEAAACFEAGAGARLLRDASPTLLLAWAQALTRRPQAV
jgi:DNA-binding response OmpR family regulator